MNDNKAIRLSKWTHVIQKNGAYAVFHSLCLSLLFLEERYADLLNELRLGTTLEHLRQFGDDVDDIVAELIEQQLVVPVEYDDDCVLREKQKTYVYQPTLETIFILLTDMCNLACHYCMINGNMPEQCKGSKAMTWDIAKEAVDMYFANIKPTKFHKTIVFYGGEPLLAFPLIKQIVGYIHDNYGKELAEFKIGLLLITNGTKITEEIAGYLAQHPEITICVSLDGLQETNDQKRVYCGGKGTFCDITRGIELLHCAGRKDINISATIDEHNVDKLDELLTLHQQYQFQTVNFNLMLDTAERMVDASYTEHATTRMLEYFEKAREIGLYEDRIMRKVRAIGKGVLHPFDCRATGAQLAISPNGSLGICHEGVGCGNSFFGKVSKDFIFSDHLLIQEWGRRSPLTMPQCFNCPSLGLCGGGCAYSAFLKHGTIWAIDDKFCKHSLGVLNWLIWDVYKQI
ncbi:MAG: radical SAM protein [Candidatus Staskawiczbacteria bacterium]|jgi:uncharacterized protein